MDTSFSLAYARCDRLIRAEALVSWQRVVVLVVDLYLIGSAGGALLWRYLEWRLARRGPWLARENQNLRALQDAEMAHVDMWPDTPRSGAYGDLDRQAIKALTQLSLALAEASRLRLAMGSHTFTPPSIAQVLSLAIWGQIGRNASLLRRRRALHTSLALADDLDALLHQLSESADQIPFRLRAQARECRTETERLRMAVQVEQGIGTRGLEGIEERLSAARGQLDDIDRLLALNPHAASLQPDGAASASHASSPERVATGAVEAEAALRSVSEELLRIQEDLSNASAGRIRAGNMIERVSSAIALAQERWSSLTDRGTVPSELGEQLSDLEAQLRAIEARHQARTIGAYEEVESLLRDLDAEVSATAQTLTEIEQMMGQSRSAIEGDVKALARANNLCQALIKEEPLLDLDTSLALIERASQAYMAAEEQRALGSRVGYQASLEHAQHAREILDLAIERAERVPETVSSVREMLAQLDSERLGDWRARADSLNEELRVYARHWESGLAGRMAEAISLLEQVEVDLERVPPNIRFGRRLRQSELDEAIELLRHATESMAAAEEAVTTLEQELEEIQRLRDRASSAMSILLDERVPALLAVKDAMLEERQSRVEELAQRIQSEGQYVDDPSATHYGDLMASWLPEIVAELRSVEADHASDVTRLKREARSAASRLGRAWNRLARLDPKERPRPEEDVDALRRDIEDWRDSVDACQDNPAILQRLAGREALSLEQRADRAIEEIGEGRRAIEAQSKVYLRHAQRIRDLRAALEDMVRASNWPKLSWDLEEAERVWTKALALERDSGSADRLVEAANDLQTAVNTAQQAEQLYALAEQQIRTAVGRLDDESRVAADAISRGRSRVRELRQMAARGEPVADRVELVEDLVDQAARALGAAQQATSFEDAMRLLREATNLLART